MSDKYDWYCPNCGFLPGCRVTYWECCDSCHCKVSPYIQDDQDSSVLEKEAAIADKANQLVLAERDRCLAIVKKELWTTPGAASCAMDTARHYVNKAIRNILDKIRSGS